MRTLTLASLAMVVFAACSTDRPNADEDTPGSVTAAHTAGTDAGMVAPPHLILEGAYSDVRFCSMMAPHHQHATEMAKVEIEAGHRPELVRMAEAMIRSQSSEIEELKSIKASLTGDSTVPAEMAPHTMENSGVPMPMELRHGHDVDSAFLDGMLPHHAGALEMATVALRHSQNARIVGMARRIVDEQSKEIGELISMREQWYAGLSHGFPHAP